LSGSAPAAYGLAPRQGIDVMSDPQTPNRREFVYRTIQLLMLGDVLLGLVLLVLGLFVFDVPALAVGGAVLACMGVGLALIYRMLGRRLTGSNGATRPSRPRESPHQLRR
jgi:hypothetical protein